MKHLFKIASIWLLLGFILVACKKNVSPQISESSKRGVIAEKAMVVSAREEASKIGTAIMQQGGNAFDAMIATEMALAVCYPFAGNLGGGGFMVYRLADGTKGSLDYREKAPMAATKNMYLDSEGKVIPGKSTLGAMAVGVPGTIAGIFEAHEKFGGLDIKTILQPVIELAQNGFVVTKDQEAQFRGLDSLFTAVNGNTILFNKNIFTGDTIKNFALSETLKRIAQNGKNEFYEGETADSLIAFLQRKGGIITHEDLKRYQAVWRDPITFQYRDVSVTSMAPPSSGGITMAQIVGMLQHFDLKGFEHNSQKYIQVLVEAERRAFADRNYYLGDPDFVEIPTNHLLSDVYLLERMADFSFEAATPSELIQKGNIQIVESDETTHYSIVDQFGNAIAVTTTLNGAYGSKLFSSELGFFLNNEMDDFSSKPGEPNMFGLIGAEANSIAPEKRMLSSMTPTIVEKDGALLMTIGTPGGSTIITSVLQTVLNVVEFDMTMQEAVNVPRFHHQWLPDEIRLESGGFNTNLKSDLKNLGYTLSEQPNLILGSVNGILMLENGNLEGGADQRRGDKAVGF